MYLCSKFNLAEGISERAAAGGRGGRGGQGGADMFRFSH